jgi:hypothetical protein
MTIDPNGRSNAPTHQRPPPRPPGKGELKVEKNVKAFPSESFIKVGTVAESTIENQGMDLRDWFAGQALAGELSGQCEDYEWDPNQECTLAKRCYSVADEMMKARKKS